MEKEAIKKWLEDNDTDPITNESLDKKDIIPIFFAKKQIDNWKEQHKNWNYNFIIHIFIIHIFIIDIERTRCQNDNEFIRGAIQATMYC